MGIIAINVFNTGLVGETVNPRRCTMITTDNLATVTTAGYLNNQNSLGNEILPTDLFDVIYSYNTATKAGTFGIFQLTYSVSTGFTMVLWDNPGNVLLPVVNGDFAIFNGTGGQIKDGGYLPSNAALTNVVMQSAASVTGDVPQYNDVKGTLVDSGVAFSALQLKANIHGGTASAAGGAAAQAFTIPNLLSTSIFIPQIKTQATGTVYIESFVVTTGTATITFSADPGAVTINYALFVAAQ